MLEQWNYVRAHLGALDWRDALVVGAPLLAIGAMLAIDSIPSEDERMLETFENAYTLADRKGDERRKCEIARDGLDYATLRGEDDLVYSTWSIRELACETSAAIRVR